MYRYYMEKTTIIEKMLERDPKSVAWFTKLKTRGHVDLGHGVRSRNDDGATARHGLEQHQPEGVGAAGKDEHVGALVIGGQLHAAFHADEPGVWFAGGSPQGLFTTANFPGAAATNLSAAQNLYALLTGRVSSIAAIRI